MARLLQLLLMSWVGAHGGTASAADDELFPFEAPERSRAGTSVGFDGAGGESISAWLDKGFLAGTRVSAGGGLSGAQHSNAQSQSWQVGLASSPQEDFAFSVRYEGWQRATPRDARREHFPLTVATRQVRSTQVAGVRTSLDWLGDHWQFSASPDTRRIRLENDIRSEERFSVGARVLAGFFGWQGWDGSAWWGETWYSNDFSQFANGYRSQGGQLALDLYRREIGTGFGYSWAQGRAGLAYGQETLALSGDAQNWVTADVKWRLENAWTVACTAGAMFYPAQDPLWFVSPRVEVAF